MVQRGIGDVGIVLFGLHPLVAEALQLIDEARGVTHLTLVGGKLDGKLVIVVAQHEFIQLIQRLLKDHATLVFLSDTQLLSEEFQTTEDGALIVIGIRDEFGVDHIDTAKTSHENHAVVGTRDGALVIGSLLQAVPAAETTHHERPLAAIFFLRYDVRDTVLRHYPHRVEFVFNDTYHTRADES